MTEIIIVSNNCVHVYDFVVVWNNSIVYFQHVKQPIERSLFIC